MLTTEAPRLDPLARPPAPPAKMRQGHNELCAARIPKLPPRSALLIVQENEVQRSLTSQEVKPSIRLIQTHVWHIHSPQGQ